MIRFQAIFLFLVCSLLWSPIQAQKKKSDTAKANQKVIVIARIQVHASLAKGTPIAEVFNMPPFFGAKSEELTYRRRTFLDQLPPSTGDSIRDLTSDSMAVFLKQDLTTMSGYGDKGGNSKEKRNFIHDLPTENPQKMAVDTLFNFDEAIDIGCYWTFVPDAGRTKYIPTVIMKLEIFDKSGQVKSEKSVTLSPSDIKTAHFKKNYKVEYDFVKGIPLKEIEEGGIIGNVVADVYLQALTKLLKSN